MVLFLSSSEVPIKSYGENCARGIYERRAEFTVPKVATTYPAILANTATLIVAMDVNTHLVSLDLFVVLALIGVAIALTRLALELVALLIRSPLLLNESRHTLLTLVAASVVRTTTDQLVRSTLIKVITHLGMTVTDTTTADRDITDTVEILRNQTNHSISFIYI